ncbi:hypothetical protein GJV07_11790 [Enterobacteriaceae bacterium RIT711]|nr:hypothetical protein [Enterobacteriaceae bacterium RIT711]
MTKIFALFKDPYERQARLIPGLLLALPLLIPLISVYGAKNPILTAVVGVLSSCGAIYGLANISRGMGKRLEERLIEKWSGMPTTIILRHRDKYLDVVTKQRYHDAITKKLGIAMPSQKDEEDNPASADDIYKGATRRLRELTRKNKGLLFKDNIAYGFHRNMAGVKVIGILSSLLGVMYGLIIAGVITVIPPHFEPLHFANPGLPAGLTLLISGALLLSWLFYFNQKTIKLIGYSYAERLLECLPSLTVTVNKKK